MKTQLVDILALVLVVHASKVLEFEQIFDLTSKTRANPSTNLFEVTLVPELHISNPPKS